jgi:hypothetical protein
MKMVKIVGACLLAVALAFGCGDDTTNNNDNGATSDGTEEQLVQPAEKKECNNPDLAELACTSARRIDGLLDPVPYVVSDYIFEKAKAANRQCKEYADLLWIYQESMRAINSGDDPDDVKFWFIETMAAIVSYDPTEECPGGCDE